MHAPLESFGRLSKNDRMTERPGQSQVGGKQLPDVLGRVQEPINLVEQEPSNSWVAPAASFLGNYHTGSCRFRQTNPEKGTGCALSVRARSWGGDKGMLLCTRKA